MLSVSTMIVILLKQAFKSIKIELLTTFHGYDGNGVIIKGFIHCLYTQTFLKLRLVDNSIS